jgi:hypothetical protein
VKIVCAWCGGETGEKDGGGVDGVSHTMCKGCLGNFTLSVEAREDATGGNETSGDEVKNGRKEGYGSENRGGYGVRGY